MRTSIINGNGSVCDKCLKSLYPKEVIHIDSKVLHKNKDKACTGHMTCIGKIHLCINCYKELQENFIKFKEPRKITKNN